MKYKYYKARQFMDNVIYRSLDGRTISMKISGIRKMEWIQSSRTNTDGLRELTKAELFTLML